MPCQQGIFAAWIYYKRSRIVIIDTAGKLKVDVDEQLYWGKVITALAADPLSSILYIWYMEDKKTWKIIKNIDQVSSDGTVIARNIFELPVQNPYYHITKCYVTKSGKLVTIVGDSILIFRRKLSIPEMRDT